VVGEISAFEMNSSSTVDSADEANFIVEYRVVELAPREVRWANTANLRSQGRSFSVWEFRTIGRKSENTF